ncbi:MAG: hypothetical protein H7A38_01965 [Chlamydiales bacterium]|nr:hypothetical protein [Chlamydiales bacterium]
MGLFEEIRVLEGKIEKAETVEELRELLEERGLNLVVVIFSKGCYCIEWDLALKRLVKVVDLCLRVRISDAIQSVESHQMVPVRIRETAWEEIEVLFQTLKRGIGTCVQNIKP